MTRRAFKRILARLCMLALFLLLFGAYAASPVRTSADSRWSIHTAMSFVRGHDGRLNEYAAVIKSERGYAIFYEGGNPYTMFPIGTSLLSVPFVWLAEEISPGLNTYLAKNIPANFEGIVASLFGAVTGCLFFAVVAERFHNALVSLAATAVFCFATSMWSVATRALWQHGPLAMMLTVAMLVFTCARRDPSRVQYAGVPLAFAFVIRPTAAIPILVFTAYVVLFHRRWLPGYVLGAALVAIPWLVFNAVVFHRVLPFYYLPGRLSGGTVAVALLGNLVSPGRGLFVFSPVLLCALPGFVLSLRERADRPLNIAFGAIMPLHWVMVSRFPHWWGGYCFGPRLMSDLLPFAGYFVAFAVSAAVAERVVLRRALATSAIAILAAISVAIHSQGAISWAPSLWSIQPVSVDEHPERLWDWSDLQFLHGVKTVSAMPDFGPLLPGLAVECTLGRSDAPLKLSFGTNWRRPDCPQSGWFGPEQWGMWSGAEASLEIPIAAGAAPLPGVEIVGDVRGVVSSLRPADDVDVLVNGVVVARWSFTASTSEGERRAVVPAVLTGRQTPLRIAFRPLAPRSPAELGLSADPRRLGIGLSRLVVRAVR